MARARKPIDPKKVRQLAGMGLTVDEVAAVLECSKRTLERECATALKEGRTRLSAALKRRQFAAAAKGSVTMLVWLGKQYLGQTDKVDATSQGKRLSSPVIILPDNGRDRETPATTD